MSETLSVFCTTATATAVLMLMVWLLSLVKKDASIVDTFWGLGFVLIAAVSYAATSGYHQRKVLVTSLAATLITDLELAELEKLLKEMDAANKRGNGEEVDRQFHQAIADATRNHAMASVVESLWTIRLRSPQCIRLFQKSRAKGTQPVVAEHRAILNALRAHDAQAAREAMQKHLKKVLDYLLDATESEVMAEARAKSTAQRDRFTAGSRLARK